MVNRAFPSNNGKTFCDPSSLDADIGMLSCGLGYECIVDDASPLGGVCATSTSRQLQENDVCYVCPTPFTLAQGNYSIVIEDNESVYGGKTCGDIKDAAYYSLSVDASSCEAASSTAQAAGCCGPMCELCYVGSYVSSYDAAVYDNVVDGISLPGYDGAVTCKDLVSAAYMKGLIDVESCPASRQAAIQAGCCVALQCRTCEVGLYIPPEEILNITTCNNLRPSELIYFNNTFSEENCLASTELAANEGCCRPRRTYDDCDVCGNATFYPENFMFRVGTCEYAKSILDEEYCAAYGEDLVPFCCGPAVPQDDADAGDPPAADPAPTPVPPSASSPCMWWSTGSSSVLVVSSMIMGFTISSTLPVGVGWLGLN